MVLMVLMCTLSLAVALEPEFPILRHYLPQGCRHADLSEFINSHYIRIKLPAETADLPDSSLVGKGRGNGLSKYLLLVLIAFKIKLALFWIALAAVAIKSFLAGLVLAKNVAVFVHQDRGQPFLYRTPSYRFEGA